MALTWAGLTAVKPNPVRLLTVIWAVCGEFPSPVATVTLTVPLVTIAPDHLLLVPLPLTGGFPLLSANFQFENVLPAGPEAVHVAVPPRATEEVQLRLATFAGPLGLVGS
jgi:hypothetical protein